MIVAIRGVTLFALDPPRYASSSTVTGKLNVPAAVVGMVICSWKVKFPEPSGTPTLDGTRGTVAMVPGTPLKSTFTSKSVDVGLLDGVTVTVSVSVTLPPPEPWPMFGSLKVAVTVGPTAFKEAQATGA